MRLDANSVDWEAPLIARVRSEAATPERLGPRRPAVAPQVLAAAHRHCAAITRDNSRIVALAASLLPSRARQGLRALYALVRVSDDLSERRTPDRHAAWDRWLHTCLHAPDPEQPVSLAWADTVHRHRVPPRYARQLLEGLRRDLDRVEIPDFAALVDYCYDVACPVPLMAMHIVGPPPPAAIPYAIRLGVALQLTNLLRDVGEDFAEGRVYLPQDELDAFGIDHQQLAQGRVDARWRDFMRFQLARARAIYRSALPGIDLLPPMARVCTGAIAELYLAMQQDIEAGGYDVFRRRARVSDWHKLRRLPGIGWRALGRGYGRDRDAIAPEAPFFDGPAIPRPDSVTP